MTTTFEKYAGWYQNYCSRPTKDVEIIEPQNVCVAHDFIPYPAEEQSFGHRGESGPMCRKSITWVADKSNWMGGYWVHTDGSVSEYHQPRTGSVCYFCGNADPDTVHYRQMSYSDEVHCDRCGGHHGYGIGD